MDKFKTLIDRYGVIILLCIFAMTILAALIACIILAAGGRWWQVIIGILGGFGTLAIEGIMVIGIIQEIKGARES